MAEAKQKIQSKLNPRELGHFIETVSRDFGLDLDVEYKKVVQASLADGELGGDLRAIARQFGPAVLEALDLPPMPGAVCVTVTEDAHAALVRVDPPVRGGEAVTQEQALAAARESGVRHGLDESRLAEAVKLGASEPVLGFWIARATEAKDGEPGRLERLAGSSKTMQIDSDAAGFIPKAELDQVRAGDAVARYAPPTAGEAGVNVRGEAIPALPGRPLQIEMGLNVRYDDKTRTFYAESPGRVVMSETDISVENLLEIPEDLDIEKGHTRFDGELFVKGYIRSNLTVTVDGDIVVEGGVEAARVSSVGGSILVKRGFQGGGYGMIQALYDIAVKFIDKGNVMAGGNIETESIMHSEVAAAEAVWVTKGRGVIIGGRVFGGQMLEVNELGSPAGTVTEIDMGLRPAELARLTDLKRKRGEAEQARLEAESALREMSGGSPILQALGSSEISRLAKLLVVLTEKCRALEKQDAKFLKMISRRTDAVARVRGVVHPGVSVRIGPAVHTVIDPLRGVEFRYDSSIGRVAAKPL